jgi:hypothetical protein
MLLVRHVARIVTNVFQMAKFFMFRIPVAGRSKAWVCGRSLPGTAVSTPAADVDIYLSLVLCVLC